MSEGKIRVVIKRPDEKIGHMTNISPSLENLQRTVDGYIEFVQLTPNLVMIVNEEGRIRNMEFNCRIAGIPVHGTLILAGLDLNDPENDLCNIPIDFQAYKRMLGVQK